MAVIPSPTVRRKRLGTELRRLREQARLTCESVGQRLDCSGTRISRMETGRISVRPGDVRELLEVYGVTGDRADALVELAREARRKGWWHRFGPVTPSWLEPYLGLEAEAARLREFQSMVLPGLLQTEDYARAMLRTAPGAGPADDIEQQVALRMARQQVLGGTAPPELCLVLGEGVLRVQVGGPSGDAGPAAEAGRGGRPRPGHAAGAAAARGGSCATRSARSPSSTSPTRPTRRRCTPST